MIDARSLAAPGLVEADLPEGVCGRITGVALTYGVVDAYGTRFRKGCLERSRQKVNAGKVGLYIDHTYDVDHHAGVLRSMRMVGDEEHITADLFDTEPGRKAKAWIKALLAAGVSPGQSVGFFDNTREDAREMGVGFKVRASESVIADGQKILEFTEIELEELSLTPRPAVPGARVTGVRSELRERHRLALAGSLALLGPDAFREIIDEVLRGRTEDPDTDRTAEADTSRTDAEDTPHYVTDAERLLAFRRSFGTEVSHGGGSEEPRSERAEGGSRAAA